MSGKLFLWMERRLSDAIYWALKRTRENDSSVVLLEVVAQYKKHP